MVMEGSGKFTGELGEGHKGRDYKRRGTYLGHKGRDY